MKKEKKITFQNSKGQKLVGVLNIPNKKSPAVIFCYGFVSNKESKKAKRFEKLFKDFVFLRFDFSNNGESDGKIENITLSQQIDDLKCAIDYLENINEVDNSIYVIGSSLGGTTAILEAANDKRIKALVLISPLSDFKDTRRKEFKDVENWKKKGFVITKNRIGKEFKINYSYYEDGIKHNVYKEAKKIKIPVLIIHGNKDERVPIEQSKRLFDVLDCDKKFEIIKNCNHWYLDKKNFDKMTDLTVNFLKGLK